MTEDPRRILSNWDVPLSRIAESGTKVDQQASDEACEALAAELSVDALQSLRFEGLLVPARHRPGDVELRGRLTATVDQTCSVSLEPMTTLIDEPVEVRITAQMPETAESSEDEELPVLEQEDIDVFENGRVPLGRIAYETLASLIDPYPRKADEEAGAWTTGEGADETASGHPFAALSRLKSPPAEDD